MVRSQRKGAVAIALQVVALQPARILAAKGRPAAEWPFRSLWTRGEGRAARATLPSPPNSATHPRLG